MSLEAGRRYITVDEFAHLPLVLELLGVAAGTAEVRLESHAALVQVAVPPILDPKAQHISIVTPVEVVPALQHESSETVQAAYRGAGGDLEQKVGRQIGVNPLIVALVALRTWGRSLSEERDRRVAEHAATGTTPRAIQALRGHITRALRKELAPQLARARRRLRGKRGHRR